MYIMYLRLCDSLLVWFLHATLLQRRVTIIYSITMLRLFPVQCKLLAHGSNNTDPEGNSHCEGQDYLNLWHTERCRGHPFELELAQLPVAAGHPALPSVDDKGHVGLVVMHSGEDLLAMARHCEGGGDEHVLLVPHHGNAHRWPLLRQLPPPEHVLVGGGACGANIPRLDDLSRYSSLCHATAAVCVVGQATADMNWLF